MLSGVYRQWSVVGVGARLKLISIGPRPASFHTTSLTITGGRQLIRLNEMNGISLLPPVVVRSSIPSLKYIVAGFVPSASALFTTQKRRRKSRIWFRDAFWFRAHWLQQHQPWTCCSLFHWMCCMPSRKGAKVYVCLCVCVCVCVCERERELNRRGRGRVTDRWWPSTFGTVPFPRNTPYFTTTRPGSTAV